MNKRLGLLVTACMFGGGLCLNPGDAVEAQFASPKPPTTGSIAARHAEPNHSLLGIITPRWAKRPGSTQANKSHVAAANDIAPDAAHKLHGAPPKKSPRLLSDALKNSSKPAVTASGRPSPKPALNANNTQSKPSIPAASANRFALPNSRPPMPNSRPGTPVARSGVQHAGHEQQASSAQSLAQNQHSASPIQQQLEELYRREGRPMPAMNLAQSPAGNPTAPNQRSPQLGANEIVRPTPQPSIPPMMNPDGTQTHIVPPASKTSRVTGFLTKINPFKGKSSPASSASRSAAPTQNFAGKPIIRPQVNAPVGQVIVPNSVPRQAAPAALPVITPAPLAPAVVDARPAVNPLAATSSELSDSLPPVPGEPGFETPTTSVDEALQNAFADMPEKDDEAMPESAAKPAKPDNPFSGVALDEQPAASTEPKVAASEKPMTDLDDLLNDLPTPAATKTADAGNSLEVPPAPDEGDAPALSAQTSSKDVDSKMKLIAERGDLRGLKGFCPVALRDERDLKNAMPEHSSTFKGRTLYFSSADAKTAFDEHPELYAPAATGNDVVLLKEKTTKEGSLDHAVWFKDRLYLFTSQKTLEQFVAAPSEFAINE